MDYTLHYFIELCYRGFHYNGWQRQPNGLGVQQVLEEALTTLLGHKVEITGSGRTDAGVNALMQVAHFDSHNPFNAEQLVHRLNRILPNDVAVFRIYQVPKDFHARFSAISRSYEYRICPNKDPFATGLSWIYTRSLNIDLMNQASQRLLYHTDYEAFCKVHTAVKNFLCKVSEAKWTTEIRGQQENIIFHITANRFLRGMVRALVGTLVEVGMEKLSLEEFDSILHSRDRGQAGKAAPPEGLYLCKIVYPSHDEPWSFKLETHKNSAI